MKRCNDCAHFSWWMEYGQALGDCGNDAAIPFIDSLDGVQDPAAAGCPHFIRSDYAIEDQSNAK